jgi:hypothetical protein
MPLFYWIYKEIFPYISAGTDVAIGRGDVSGSHIFTGRSMKGRGVVKISSHNF